MRTRRGRVKFDENAGAANTPERKAQQNPAAATPAAMSASRLRPLAVSLAVDAAAIPIFSPGSGGATPELFTVRKGVLDLDSLDSAPACAVEPAKEESIKVVVRIRPHIEQGDGGGLCVAQTAAETLTLLAPEACHQTFDHVAGPKSRQEHLFKVVGRPMAENALSGFNSTVLCYGQTGTGKTHTMLGMIPDVGQPFPEEAGLIPRLFRYLFNRIGEMEGSQRGGREIKFVCSCSMLEIYQEVVTDLLNPSATKLQIREGDKVYVEGLSQHAVGSVDDVLALLVRGAEYRHIAATKINSESSRSHCIFTCCIESRTLDEGGCTVRSSQLHLVDLAGSERQKVAETEGTRLKEAASINKSLLSLGLVINRLVEGQGLAAHVPYRDSKLTFLLQESLGGNARTVLVANISPAASCLSETQNTLAFARRASSVRNKVLLNENVTVSALELQLEVARLRREVAILRGLQDPGADGSSQLAEALQLIHALEDKVARLQEQLLAMRRKRDSLDTELGQQAAAAAEEGTVFKARAEEVMAQLQELSRQHADQRAFLDAQQVELKGLTVERDGLQAALQATSKHLTERGAAVERLEGEVAVLRAQVEAKEGGLADEAVPEIATQISAMEATVAALNEHQQKLLRRNEELAVERDSLQQRVQDLECRASNAETVATAGKEQVASLRTENAALQEMAQRMGQQAKKLVAEKQQLGKRCGELEVEVYNSRNSGESTQQQLAGFRLSLAAMKEQLASLESSKAAAVERVEALQAELQRREAEAQHAADEVESRDRAMGEAARRHAEQVRALEEESMSLRALAAYEEKHRQMAQKEQLVLLHEAAQLEVRHAELLASLNSAELVTRSLDGAREENNTLQAAITDLQRTINDLSAEGERLRDQLAAKAEEQVQLARQLVEAGQRAQEAEGERLAVQLALQQAQEEGAGPAALAQQLEKDLHAAQAAVAEAHRRSEVVAEELTFLHSATEAEALEAKAQVEQLQAALSAARAEAADAQHIAAVQLAATQSGLESARGQLATSRASEVEMKGTIKGLRSEAAAAAWEMQQLQTALGELVGRLAAEAAERERKERELMQQIADCKDEVEQLTAQCSELAQRLQQEHSTMAHVTSTNQALSEVCAIKDDELQQLQAEVEVKRACVADMDCELAALRNQLEESQRARDLLQDQLAQAEQDLRASEADAATKAESVQALSSRLAETKSQLASRAADVEARDASISQLEAGLAAACEEAAASMAAMLAADAQLEAARDQLSAAEEQLSVQAQQLDATEEALGAARSQAEETSSRLAAQASTCAALEQSAAELTADLEAAQRRAEERAAAIKAGDLRCAGLEAQLAALQKKLQSTEATLQAYDGVILDLENQLSAAENSLAATALQLASSVARGEALDAELVEAQRVAREKASDLQAREWRIDDLTVQLADLRSKLLESGGQVHAAGLCVAELEAALQAALEEGEAGAGRAAEQWAQVDSLQKELATVQGHADEGAQRASALEEELAAAQHEAAVAAAQLATHQATVAALGAQLAEVRESAAGHDSRSSDLEAAVAALQQQLKEAHTRQAVMVRENVNILRTLQAEVQDMKLTVERRDREAKQLREALHQAMADATDKAAAVVEERVAHEGALAALKRQVSQLQAGESAKAQRLMAALAKSDELRQQVDGLKEELRSKAAAVCAATAELEATRLETERLRRKKARRDEEVTALAVQVQKMQARLDERVENLQAQEMMVAAAREQEQRIRALQREQARLLEELGRAQAALEQGATASSPAGAPSPPAQAPPSVDIGRLLRDQKDVLHAQHEAAISDLKASFELRLRSLDNQRAEEGRQRDAAVAELGVVRQQASAVAAERDRAAADAAQVQGKLLKERTALMASLKDLQQAFRSHESKHLAGMLDMHQQLTAKEALLAQGQVLSLHPPPPDFADMENAVMVQQSLDGSAGSAGSAPVLRLRSPNVRPPSAGHGWREGEEAHQSSGPAQSSPLGKPNPRHNMRRVVGQGENVIVPLPSGSNVTQPSVTVTASQTFAGGQR